MHVPYMAGCGSGYYPYASPITTSDDVVVVEELGDNYSCHVYATSRTAKINMPHEEISFVNYNTFSTSSGDGFSGHGLHNGKKTQYDVVGDIRCTCLQTSEVTPLANFTTLSIKTSIMLGLQQRQNQICFNKIKATAHSDTMHPMSTT